jgi:hypothetical protein
LIPGPPMRVAWVEARRVAGLGRAGELGGMLMVSLAAVVRAAALRSESMEGRSMVSASFEEEGFRVGCG